MFDPLSSASEESSDLDEEPEVECEEWIDCDCCPAQVLMVNCARHTNKKQKKCPYCHERLRDKELEVHIQSEHMTFCRFCGEKLLEKDIEQHELNHLSKCEFCHEQILQEKFQKHLQEKHSIASVIGVVRSLQMTDTKFNELVAKKRIYACDGLIYMK